MAVAKTSCKQWSAWKLTERTTERNAASLGSPCSLWIYCCGYSGHRRVALDAKMETKTKRKRHQHETKAKRERSERTQYEPKTDPKCNQNGAQMHQNQVNTDPKPAQRIQDDPKRSKLAQVCPSVDPKIAHVHLKTAPGGISKPTFSGGKTTIWAKRAILGSSRMKALQKQTY